jgi:ribosome-binding factor A
MYYERKKQSAFKRDPVDTDMTLRQKRVSMLVQEALEQVFAVDFEHESVPQLLIEGVEMSVDMRRCKILFGSDDKGVDGFLHRQGPAIRMLLTRRVQMKYSPTLDFIRTDFEKKQARLDAVLDSVLLLAEGEEQNVVGEVE